MRLDVKKYQDQYFLASGGRGVAVLYIFRKKKGDTV